MIMKIKKLDELELIKRGNIFKHCLFTVIGLLFVHIAMMELNIILMSQRNAVVLIIIFIVSLFCIEMICYGIFPLSEKRQKFVYIIAGLCGVAAVIFTVIELLYGEEGFIVNEMLSDTGTVGVMGCLLFAILLAYVIKSICSLQKTSRGEDE